MGILINLAESMRSHLLEHILPFWCGPAVDREQGGWMAWLSNDLTADRTKPKGLIVNARILWTFSAVHRFRAEPIYREMADRAFDVVMNRFWDSQYGGAFWQLNDRFEVLDDSKKTYGQAFYIYALVEYYQAFGTAMALTTSQETVSVDRAAYARRAAWRLFGSTAARLVGGGRHAAER